MCGRYASSRSDAELVDAFGVDDVVGPPAAPSWNVAPTQGARAVLVREDRRELRVLRWGLVPAWADGPSGAARMINARAETVTERPAFRRAASRRRALLPADGYFEWERREVDGKVVKVPHYLHAADGGLLAFAGLYELWRDPARAEDDPDRWLWSAAVLTTTASDALGRIHDRSPVVVPPSMHEDWLDPGLTDPELVRQVVAAVPEPHLAAHEVGRAVGSPRVDGPQLVLPLAPDPAAGAAG